MQDRAVAYQGDRKKIVADNRDGGKRVLTWRDKGELEIFKVVDVAISLRVEQGHNPRSQI